MFPSRRKKERRIDTGYDPEPIAILHISTPKSWRGGEQQLVNLYEELEEKGVQQSILCPKGSALEEDCKTHERPHICFTWKGPLALGVALKLRSLLKGYRPDLIHTHDSHAHTAAYIAARLSGGRLPPLIVHRRVDFPVGSSSFSRKKYDHPSVKRVIAVSDAIRRIGTEGVEIPEKWVTVHSGIDPGAFKGEAQGILRKELGLRPETPIIGNVAALADHKDHPCFVRTAHRFFEKGGKGHFVIIGEGPERERVEQEVENYALQGKLSLLGFRKDVRDLMKDFDIFLMSSKTEGLGTSVLDAMASGIPIVSTNAGGLPETVEQGRTGMLCEVGDEECLSEALLKLLNDQEERDLYAKKGIERAEERSRKKMADHVYRIYCSVLERAL